MQSHMNKMGFLKETRVVELLRQFNFPQAIEIGICAFTRKYPITNEDTFISFCQTIQDVFWKKISEVNKLSSLGYMYNHDWWDIYNSLMHNIDFLSNAFWSEIFLKKNKNQIHWNSLSWESDLFINLNWWTWAGTFSIDLAIWWLNNQRTWINPLVHVSFDTMMVGNKRIGRIIRLWRVIKVWEEAKKEMLAKYMREFKGSPESYLIQSAIRILADLGITEFIWLSTDGAYKLSSLGKSKSWFDYSRLFHAAWFSEPVNNWHELNFPDWNWYKYFATQTTRYTNTSLIEHFDSCDQIPEIKKLALQNIQTKTRDTVSLLIAWSIIAWKFWWNIADL